MKISTVICEYNPFHNGHKYQLEYMKSKSDAVICIMSGDFVQRGEAAIFDKFTRTKAALLSGADLVIMLPVCFSLNTAERFAFGGVSLANALGVCDNLCFGSESGDIKKLSTAADLLINEPRDVSDRIKSLMGSGISYPKARSLAFLDLIDSELITKPNNILATEYIKALKALESKIIPDAISRKGTGYHDTSPSGEFASASAIRAMISNKEDYSFCVPDTAFELFKNASVADTNLLSKILMYLIRTKNTEEIALINDISEGLENRIKSAISECITFEEIAEYVKSKRYTLTKIKRILLSLIIGIDKNIASSAPQYIRVLGMNETGAKILGEIKEKSNLTIVTKTADYKGFNKSFDCDILAGDIYSFCCGKTTFGRDYVTSPIIIK